MLSTFNLHIIVFTVGDSSYSVVFELVPTNAILRFVAKFVNNVEVKIVDQFDKFKETYFKEVIKYGAAFTLGFVSKFFKIFEVEIFMDFDSVPDAELAVFVDNVTEVSKVRAIVIYVDIIDFII